MAETLKFRVEGDPSGAERAFRTVRKGARDMGSRMKDMGRKTAAVGKTMTRRATLPIVGMATAVGRTAMTYESSMNRVEAATEAPADQMEAMRELTKDLGRETQFSANESADALYFLSSAGFEVNEAMDALPGVLNLAAAGGMELAEASDIATNILSGYNMEVDELGRVNDTLVKAFQNANVNVSMLGESFSHVAPVASSAGLEFEEVTASLALLGDAGIQGSKGGTAVRNAITKLLDPAPKAQKALDRLGVEVLDNDGNMRDLSDIVGQLAGEFPDLSEHVLDAEGNFIGTEDAARNLEQAGADTADLMAIFGQRAGPAMAALVAQGSDGIEDMTETLRDSEGAAEDASDTMMQGLPGAFERMKSAVEGFMLSIGDAGLTDILESAAEFVGDLAGRLSELDPTVTKVAVAIAGVVAVAGPLLTMIGFMMQGVGGLAVAFGAVSAPVLAVVAAVGALVAGLVIAYNRSETFRQIVHRAFAFVRDFISEAMEVAREVVLRVLKAVHGFWHDYGSQIMAFTRRTWEQIQSIISSVLDVIVAVVSKVIGFIQGLWDTFGSTLIKTGRGFLETLQEYFRSIWHAIQNIISGVLDAISGIFDIFAGIFTGDWSRVWEGVKSLFHGIWQAMLGIIQGILASIRGVIRAGMNAAQGIIEGVLNGIKALWNAAWSTVKDHLSRTWNTIYEAVSGALRDLKNSISRGIDDILNWFRELPGRILGALGDLGGLLLDAGRRVIDGFIGGITGGFDRVREKLGSLTSMLPDWKGPARRDAKLLRENGSLIIQGLVDGLSAEEGAVRSVLQSLTSMIGGTDLGAPTVGGAQVGSAALSGAGAGPVGALLTGGAGPRTTRETQTSRRVEAYINVEGRFDLSNPQDVRRAAETIRDEIETIEDEQA